MNVQGNMKITGFDRDQAAAVRDLSSRVERFFHDPRALEWSCRFLRGTYCASCTLHARSGYYRAMAVGAEPETAARQVLDKLIRQRRRRKAACLNDRRH